MTDRDLALALGERAATARMVAVGLLNHMPADNPEVQRRYAFALLLEAAALSILAGQ